MTGAIQAFFIHLLRGRDEPVVVVVGKHYNNYYYYLDYIYFECQLLDSSAMPQQARDGDDEDEDVNRMMCC